MGDEIVIFITAANAAEAEHIGRTLVAEHLVACANIVDGIRSIFFWEGETRDDRETLIICKSRLPLMDAVVTRVKSIHSYKVPEIIAIPVVAGSPDYLAWVRESVRAQA